MGLRSEGEERKVKQYIKLIMFIKLATKKRGEKNIKDYLRNKMKKRLLHLEWISNEVLLYSPGNYIQSLGTDHDGR